MIDNMDFYMKSVNNRIDEVLNDCPRILRVSMGHLKKSRGKGIRANIIIHASYALTGNEFTKISSATIDFAAAIELLHLATLVHDDVIDNAVTRRGINSVQYEFGKKNAILIGDYLFTRCYRLISQFGMPLLDNFAAALGHICAGEMLQHELRQNCNITEKQYYKIIAGKTAALFAFSLYSTAKIANAPEITAERLFKSGYYMGLAFQMADDCLDYDGEEKIVKKPICKDFSEGYITYPLIYTISQKPELKKYITAFYKKNKLKPNNTEKKYIAEEVEACGGIKKTKEKATHFCEIAKKYISRAVKDGYGLMETVDFMVFRKQ